MVQNIRIFFVILIKKAVSDNEKKDFFIFFTEFYKKYLYLILLNH